MRAGAVVADRCVSSFASSKFKAGQCPAIIPRLQDQAPAMRLRHPAAELVRLCADARRSVAEIALSLAPQGLGMLLVAPAAFEEAASHLISNAITAAGPHGHV